MDEDSECNALRQVLEERCPGAKFRGDDIKKLVDAGYDTETVLAAASKDSLDRILPTRPGVVDVLVKSFSPPGREETPARAVLTPQEHGKDRSEEWIKHMLMPGLTTLPQHDYDLANVLFPEKHGKLPVNRRMYHERFITKPNVTERFLIKADDSAVPTMLTCALSLSFGPAVARIVGFLVDLFELCRSYSSYEFTYQFFFNCNETTAGSCSSSTKERSRPDTLLTASGCTFLIGEDKLSSLSDAEGDLRAKVSQEQFMLIDLESVAASPFQMPEGFQYFRGWSIEMLEGSFYTPMSDMYQLGKLLEKDVHWMNEISESALQFIRRLRSKKCTAAMALSDPWLSDPVL
ncbi:unnamed protein product [Sphagnum troendelagicum]